WLRMSSKINAIIIFGVARAEVRTYFAKRSSHALRSGSCHRAVVRTRRAGALPLARPGRACAGHDQGENSQLLQVAKRTTVPVLNCKSVNVFGWGGASWWGRRPVVSLGDRKTQNRGRLNAALPQTRSKR